MKKKHLACFILSKKAFIRNLLFCWIIVLALFGDWETAVSQSQPSNSGDFFIDVTDVAGITAVHQAVWVGKGFQEGTDDVGGRSYLGVGQAWGDYDNDGWLDLYVSGGLAENVLYHNEQDGTFTVAAVSAEVALGESISGGAVWADFDNDGWLDLYVVAKGANNLFRNLGGTGFVNVTELAGVGDRGNGQSAAWGDFDNDGFLDLYVVNWSCAPDCDPVDFATHQDVLYHNDGDGTFADVSGLLDYPKLLGAGFAASFVDYDNDRDLDIYIINDEFQNPIGNVLFRNDGPGCNGWCWKDVSAESGTDVVLSGMGIAVGDYNNDADLDFYFSNMLNAFSLLDNQGNGIFTDRAEAAGVHFGWTSTVGWGTGFFDYDNDGWQDLYLATTGFIQRDLGQAPEGMHFPQPNYLFQNNRNGSFSNVWTGPEEPSKGFAFADYDNDGWMDFIVTNWNEGFRLYRNTGNDTSSNNWLTLDLIGVGAVNLDAIGTRVYVTTEDDQRMMQEVSSGSSLGAGNDMRLHFGLGQAKKATVEVVWPNGETAVFKNIAANQIQQISYGDRETDWITIMIRLLVVADSVAFIVLLLVWRKNKQILKEVNARS